MFHKLVAIEPVSLIPSAEQELHQYAEEVTLYRDIPADDDEIVRRIGDADAVLPPAPLLAGAWFPCCAISLPLCVSIKRRICTCSINW